MRYEDMEFENLKNVYHAVCELDGPSRADVAKHLSLSRTAVSLIVSSFISNRLVVEEASCVSAVRGRPGTPLHVDNSYWRAAGASLYADSWQFVITDPSGSVISEFKIHADHRDQDGMISRLIEGINRIKDEYGSSLIPGIGVGLPGVVDSKNGDVLFAYDQSWFDRFNVSCRVKEESGLECYVMNRYTLEGMAEFRYANPERIQDMIYFGVGSGIRSAIFSDGKYMNGSHFSAGRISHLQVNPEGKKCSCGRKGCLITEANSYALVENVRDELKRGEKSVLKDDESLSASAIIKASDEGDEVALKAIKKAAVALSKVICSISDVVDPKRVVIGGPVGSSKELIKYINTELDKYFENDVIPFGRFHAERATLASISSSIGGASLVLDNMISLLLPVLRERKTKSFF